jgi:hypothetical protein
MSAGECQTTNRGDYDDVSYELEQLGQYLMLNDAWCPALLLYDLSYTI